VPLESGVLPVTPRGSITPVPRLLTSRARDHFTLQLALGQLRMARQENLESNPVCGESSALPYLNASSCRPHVRARSTQGWTLSPASSLQKREHQQSARGALQCDQYAGNGHLTSIGDA
jgi:hypothetical protein